MNFFGSRSRFGSQSAQTQSSLRLRVPLSEPSGTLLKMNLTPAISTSPMQESKSSLFIPSSQPSSPSASSSVPPPTLNPNPLEEIRIMATTPVVVENGFESFFSKFGNVLKTVFNVAANVAVDTEPTVEPLIPTAYQAGFATLVSAAAKQVAAADAKYALIAGSNVSFAQKVAEAVAVGGEGVLAIAAQEGLSINTNLTTFFSAATTIAQSLTTTSLTA